MDLLNICRCCLSQGTHKDMNASHLWLNQKEVYSEMLNECFNIILSTSDVKPKICDTCVKMLRDSSSFKQQVLRSEEEFLRRCKELKDDSKAMEVKIEPKEESADDSDDYFLADAARDVTIKKVKQEPKDPPKKRIEQRKKTKSAPKSVGKAAKLSSSINPGDFPELTITPKPAKGRAVAVSPALYQDGQLKVVWTSRARHEKAKHKENLRNILMYSNATPFKNKSLLGFTCGYCEAPYPDPAELRAHARDVHRARDVHGDAHGDVHGGDYVTKLDVHELACSLCGQRAEHLSALKEHLTAKHEKTFHNDIKDHLLQFKLKKGEVYDCAMCSSTYETFKMLKQHMNQHYRNYSCTLCDATFATRRSLSAHAATHQQGSFKCDHCEKVFTSKPKKHYHEKTKHFGARNISNCPFCDEPFKSYYQRNQHMVKVHNSEAQYKCNVCSKAYILKSLLMYHIKKNHLMERNCQCTECGFRFFSKKALKAHMIKHTGERVHACGVCHKAYARKYTLREHMRIHDNDRRFRCQLCRHAFVQKCSLKSHLLSNHGVSVNAQDITHS